MLFLFPFLFFFFNDTATTEIYTLSLHDALPILVHGLLLHLRYAVEDVVVGTHKRSEEHTSELQSRGHLVCRLLLEKKKTARAWASRVGRRSHCPVVVWGPRHGRPWSSDSNYRAELLPAATASGFLPSFFFKDRATPEISPFSLPDALPI